MELNKKVIRKAVKKHIKALMEALPMVKQDEKVPVGYNEKEELSLEELATELGYLEGHNPEDEDRGEEDQEKLDNAKDDMDTMGEGRTTDGMTPEIKATWDRYTYGDYKNNIRPIIGDDIPNGQIFDHETLDQALDNDEALQSILSSMDEKIAARQRYQLGDALGFVLQRAHRMER
tara:strand:- start:1711 stop:2238 length:528 start_codon:yes stop_codon:yes gene_type:complete